MIIKRIVLTTFYLLPISEVLKVNYKFLLQKIAKEQNKTYVSTFFIIPIKFNQ
jgi:hypothetical protein